MSAKTEILELLAEAGMSDLTVEDVLTEFTANDALASHLAGATDIEQAILANMPEYLAMKGFMGVGGADSQDPTKVATGAAGTSMPATVTPSQAAAIATTLHDSAKTNLEISEKTRMIAVLIDKPYPGEYMTNVDALSVNGKIEEVIGKIKGNIKADADVNDLLKTVDSTFIPTNAQLGALKLLHQQKHKESKNPPMWFDFDNDTAVTEVLSTLQAGGTFGAMVAPKTEQGTGANKQKAWRWATKGFTVRTPARGAGSAEMVEKDMTRKEFEGFVIAQTAGFIPSDGPGLGAKLVSVKQKQDSVSGQVQPKKAAVRITGNSPAAGPETRCINEATNERGKAVVRSEDFYFEVRVNKNGSYSVRKQRLSLVWENAPVWARKDVYKNTFPVAVKGGVGIPSPKEQAEIQELAAAKLAAIMGAGSKADRAEFGIADFMEKVENKAAEAAVSAAEALSL